MLSMLMGRATQKLFVFFSFVLFLNFPVSANDTKVFTPVVVERADGSTHDFNVELALTDKQRSLGLMHRKELAPDNGMLFIFPEERALSFWMRNTLIPLDIIFLKSSGEILNIRKMAEPLTETGRTSLGLAKAVLEIPGGRADELNIKAGDIVRHSFLRNWPVSK